MKDALSSLQHRLPEHCMARPGSPTLFLSICMKDQERNSTVAVVQGKQCLSLGVILLEIITTFWRLDFDP